MYSFCYFVLACLPDYRFGNIQTWESTVRAAKSSLYIEAATVYFSLLGLLASAAVVSAATVLDQPYSGNQCNGQLYLHKAGAIDRNSNNALLICPAGLSGCDKTFFGLVTRLLRPVATTKVEPAIIQATISVAFHPPTRN